MAHPDLVRHLVLLLAADLPSQTIHHELTAAGYAEAEIRGMGRSSALRLHGVERPRQGQITELGRRLAVSE